MSFQYTRIKIGSIFLTEGGSATGTRYAASVEGLDKFFAATQAKIIMALDGTIYRQDLPQELPQISIKIPALRLAEYTSLRNLIQSAVAAGTTIALEFVGHLGTFTFNAFFESFTQEGEHLSDSVKDVTLTFMVQV